jgi:hypothetical protein
MSFFKNQLRQKLISELSKYKEQVTSKKEKISNINKLINEKELIHLKEEDWTTIRTHINWLEKELFMMYDEYEKLHKTIQSNIK